MNNLRYYILVFLFLPALFANDQIGELTIGSGGFMTGVIAHPSESELIYSRNDVGGTYRWDPQEQRWVDLMRVAPFDWDTKGFASLAIAVDFQDVNRVWTLNSFLGGALFYSDDQGATWTESSFRSDAGNPWVGPNHHFRWTGERIAVDPNNSDILYVGTQQDGLWKSTDADAVNGNYNKVTAVPTPAQTASGGKHAGITFVLFGKNASGTDLSSRIYTGVFGEGIYASTDSGSTWSDISVGTGRLDYPIRADVTANGKLVVTTGTDNAYPGTGDGGVYSWDGSSWTDITPMSNSERWRDYNYSAVDTHPSNPNIILVGRYPGPYFVGSGDWHSGSGVNSLMISSNGGLTWYQKRFYNYTHPWLNGTGLEGSIANWLSSAIMVPGNPDQVWMLDGFSVLRTDDIWADGPYWESESVGINMIVARNILKIPGGPILMGNLDNSGFSFDDIDSQGQNFKEDFRHSTSLDYSALNSNTVVRVGGHQTDLEDSKSLEKISRGGGRTWTDMNDIGLGLDADGFGGSVAVSATDSNNIVRIPIRTQAANANDGYRPVYSTDGGQTWSMSVVSNGGSEDSDFYILSANNGYTVLNVLASDRMNGDFYIYGNRRDWSSHFYRSSDKGKSWLRVGDVGQVSEFDFEDSRVKGVPGRAGHVWVLKGEDANDWGLFYSDDRGDSFSSLSTIDKPVAFGFGPQVSGGTYPSLLVAGERGGEKGLYLSHDMGATWVKRAEGHFTKIVEIDGDKEIPGRFFFVTSSQGAFVLAEDSSVLDLPPQNPWDIIITTQTANYMANDGQLSLSFSGSPRDGEYQVVLSNQQTDGLTLQTNVDGAAIFSNLSSGQYSLNLQSIFQSNVYFSTNLGTWSVDSPSPPLAISSPTLTLFHPEFESTNGRIEYSWSGNNNDGYYLAQLSNHNTSELMMWSNENNGPRTYTAQFSGLAAQTFSLSLEAKLDIHTIWLTNLVTTNLVELEQDNQAPPLPTVLFPDPGRLLESEEALLRWTAVSDPPSGDTNVIYRLRLNDEDFWLTNSTELDVSHLPDGEIIWYMRTYDFNGNSSIWSDANTFFLNQPYNSDAATVGDERYTLGINNNIISPNEKLELFLDVHNPIELRIMLVTQSGKKLHIFLNDTVEKDKYTLSWTASSLDISPPEKIFLVVDDKVNRHWEAIYITESF